MTQYQNEIGEIVKFMHLHKIKQKEIAEKIGIRREHLNRILNFQIESQKTIPLIKKALNELVIEKSS